MELTGIILAGGKSSRMGTDKGLLRLNGNAFVEHIIVALKPFVKDILIISDNPAYEQFGVKVIGDLVKNQGPVGGIYTGLEFSDTKNNIVLSCDIPFLSSQVLEQMIQQMEKDVCVANYEGKMHPLIGIYATSLRTDFKEALKRNELKLREVLKTVSFQEIRFQKGDVALDVFSNINTQEDYKNISI